MYVVDNPREREKERDLVSTKVIERVNARYDIQEVQLGKVYKWRPESLLIECECGQRTTLTPSGTTCEECAKEHIELVGEALRDQQELRRRLREEELHPWRYAVDSEDEEDPILWV
jgi:hypothetical protein